jgi:outer membrane protein OmpA-like peptidoglycan-associated protein
MGRRSFELEPDALVGRSIAMRAVCKPLAWASLLIGLGACTTALPPEKTTALGGPFNEDLKEGYLRLAEAQRASIDVADWYHFRGKARDAMLGNTVWPDKVSSRAIPAASQPEAVAQREHLLRVLEGGGRVAAPADAAVAQTNFDCWLEELESVKDPEDFSDCRESFANALAKAQSALIHTPYLVFFEGGSDQLDPSAMNVVTYAAQAARVAEPPAIAVTGYADPSGNVSDNQALSRRRAEAVAEALRASGVGASEIRIAARGANPVPVEERARRVEITFGG